MKILMVSPEFHPFAKSGGLADVVSALSINLSKMGHELKVVMPRYYFIDKRRMHKHPLPMCIPTGEGEFWVGVYRRVVNCNLELIFLDYEDFYGRDGIYGYIQSSSFLDNFSRFNILSKGAIQTCLFLKWYPNIIHCHDWTTSLAILYLNQLKIPELSHVKSVFTIHNIAYQGIFPRGDFYKTGLPANVFYESGIESMGNINLMQLGIVQSSWFTTVSENHAREIKTSSFGFGLEGVINHYSWKFSGILNGVDYDLWSPDTDKLIYANFDFNNLEGKVYNKSKLQMDFGLEQDEEKPLICILSRLVNQKGIGDLIGPLHGSLHSIATVIGAQIVIIGSGEKWAEEEILKLQSREKNIRAFIGYNESLAHKCIAGADFILIPSLYEPCGLTQLYGLRYGTIPIVSKTGGLFDTVRSWDPFTKTGDGFYIPNPINPHNIFWGVKNAVDVFFNSKDDIKKIRENGMQKRFCWVKSAVKYEKIYEKLSTPQI